MPHTEINPGVVEVRDPLWSRRLRVDAEVSIPWQWEQLERVGTLGNFRLASGQEQGVRRGYFYTDSDAHKWAHAAANALARQSRPRLRELVDTYVSWLRGAQQPDGYLFTFNQLHFPEQRWVNLQVEHELYTLGHLVEAGIALHRATGDDRLLHIALRGAELVDQVRPGTPGHQELELALVHLHRHTGDPRWLELARHLVEERGRAWLPGVRLASQALSHTRRSKEVVRQRQEAGVEEEGLGFDLSENLHEEEPPFLKLRVLGSFLSGRYHQQHAPIRQQTVPVGHAVRWGYLQTAVALLAQETGDATLLRSSETAWEHMVARRMYVSGGVGSLPLIEGYSRDYELDDAYAYCETCAALSVIFWTWELLRQTGRVRYAELLEWELYNAAHVGTGLDGRSWLYRNPLRTRGGLQRRPWFETACCPSNVSRTWQALGRYLITVDGADLHVHLYLGAVVDLGSAGLPCTLRVHSGLPWEGQVRLELEWHQAHTGAVCMRLPGWAPGARVRVDGQEVELPPLPEPGPPTGQGLDLSQGRVLRLERAWEGRVDIALDLPLEVRTHRAHPKVRTHAGLVALSRGPVLYCAEAVDNPEAAVPEASIDLGQPLQPGQPVEALAGAVPLVGVDGAGTPLVLIPYYAWANREPGAAMQVFLRQG